MKDGMVGLPDAVGIRIHVTLNEAVSVSDHGVDAGRYRGRPWWGHR